MITTFSCAKDSCALICLLAARDLCSDIDGLWGLYPCNMELLLPKLRLFTGKNHWITQRRLSKGLQLQFNNPEWKCLPTDFFPQCKVKTVPSKKSSEKAASDVNWCVMHAVDVIIEYRFSATLRQYFRNQKSVCRSTNRLFPTLLDHMMALTRRKSFKMLNDNST